MSQNSPTVDDSLILASQKGDSHAFARLLTLIYDLIFRFALKWSASTVDAEDITQQVCIKLAKAIKQFRFESAFTTWLYRLVVNCAHDWSRSQRRHRSGEDTDTHLDAVSSTQSVESASELARVFALVEQMGKGFKETLLLVYSEGFTHKEAADVLGVKESTVSWRLHEVRKQLSTLNNNVVVEGAQ